jgi:hypothetical protein
MTVSACALSGEEALAMAKRTTPDLALVDVELAGEDGFKLARSLIAQDPTLCVVLVSAYELEDIADLVAGCGASGLISKIVRAAFERYAVPGPGRVLFRISCRNRGWCHRSGRGGQSPPSESIASAITAQGEW